MSLRDPKALFDGISLIQKGVNSGIPPISLGRDQLAWAINATFRNNYATNRPGLVKLNLDLSGLTDGTLFTSAIFQGASTFERRSQLVSMIGGRLYRIALDTWEVADITTTDVNASNRYRAWFAEAEDFIIAQDGQSAPWIYDGAINKRSDSLGIHGPRQVPSGTAMVYSGGRLLVSLTNNRSFLVGNIVNGEDGTWQYSYRDSVLAFTENDTINGGGSFSVPINSGALTAFRPVAQVDTSTGQGPTQVFTTGGVFSLNAPTDRTQWATVNFPIGTVSMIQGGSVSDRATVNVNGDIWMRSLDGVRSFLVARRDFSSWVNAPMSQEVTRAFANDDRNLLGYASAAVFNNRLIMTVNPYRVWDHGIAHRALAVLDFAPINYLNDRNPPCWEGIWTGLQVLQVLSGTFNGVDRCFIFALNSINQIELWELTKAATFDNDGTSDIPIQWSIETCSCNFPRSTNPSPIIPGNDLQALQNGLLYVDSIQDSVSFSAHYRPDQDPCWQYWHAWSVCATQTLCGTPGSEACVTPLSFQPQYRRPFRLPNPPNDCDPVTNKQRNVGAEFQVKLSITGTCRIKRLDLIAYDVQRDATGICAPNESCVADYCSECENDYSYTIS